jgi:Protein of unknown function (DUF2723)
VSRSGSRRKSPPGVPGAVPVAPASVRSSRSMSPAAGTTVPPGLRARDIAIAIGLGCGSLTLFVAMVCPTIYVEDSAEFAAASALFGVPHPPGYPLYTLLSGLFVHVVRAGDMGYRSNLFSAACGSLTAVALWLLLRRLGISRLAALAAVFCFSFGSTFWSQCLAAEVHTFNCLLLALTLLATFEAAGRPTARRFALVGLAMGFLVGHRNLNLFFVLPFLVVLDLARRRARAAARLSIIAIVAAAATGIIYAYLPLAAWHDPPLYVGAPSSLERFYAVISARAYFRHLGSGTAATDAHRLVGFLMRLPSELGLATVAAPVGLWMWRRRQGRTLPAAISCLALACIGFSMFYNVIDIDAYLLPAHLALAVGAGFGFDAVPRIAQVALPVLALGALPLHFQFVNLRNTTAARGYGTDLLRSAPIDAVVIPFGDTSTHVLWYLQAVEHARRDVVVLSSNEITDWYIDDLRRRHPAVDWPPDGATGTRRAGDWLKAFVQMNLKRRPVCLTEPLTLGISDWTAKSHGLLYCFRPNQEVGAPQLAGSVAFWKDAATPAQAELAHADVHVRMVAFSYAMARFTLARELVEAGAADGARAQLIALIAVDPDDQERAIAVSMATIGRTPGRRFSLGARARAALSVRSEDRDRLIAALAWE